MHLICYTVGLFIADIAVYSMTRQCYSQETTLIYLEFLLQLPERRQIRYVRNNKMSHSRFSGKQLRTNGPLVSQI